MRISYNITGEKRKALVEAISQELNAQIKYLGAPSFAYEVGGYHIDKNGVVTGPDNHDLEADLQGLHGFKAAAREYDEPETYESGQYGGEDIPAFENLRMDGCEELGLGRTRRENWQGENGMQANDCESDEAEPEESDQLVIEMPLEGFTEESITNLKKLVTSKANLIKKAIGADTLPIERTETSLKFPWFKFPASGDEVSAYSRFIGGLCAAAKEQKRVIAREKDVDNEKFAFRVFLIRLGFVGDEYKSARKILLRNLSGNSAFRNGRPPKTNEGGDSESEVHHE